MIVKNINNGVLLKGIEVISFIIGIYWLVYVEVNSIIWNSSIILISIINIILFILHPKRINLFYSYYFFKKRMSTNPKKAITHIRSYIPFAIAFLITMFIVRPGNAVIEEVYIIELFYVLSFIIYELSFLRGGEDFLNRVGRNKD